MGFSSLFGRILVVAACCVVATACGTETGPVPDEPTETTATIDSASGSTDGDGATTGEAELTVEKVVAWIDSTYPDPTPVCDGTGRIDVGDVFACDGPVPTAQVEREAMVIYEAYPFGALSTPETNFFWSLVYWSLEGEPDRMDADQNGVPCETLYDTAVVNNVLAGGPVS